MEAALPTLVHQVARSQWVGIAVFLAAFFSCSDFGIYLFGTYPFAVLFGISALVFLTKGPAVDFFWPMLVYVVVIGLLCFANIALRGEYNFVLFVPFFAFALKWSIGPKSRSAILLSMDLLCFVLVPALIFIELAAKITQSDFLLMKELVSNTGIGRFDVLRAKAPFGSPLSLASFFLASTMVYLFFFRSVPRAFIVLALVMLTGARTSAFLVVISIAIFILSDIISSRALDMASIVKKLSWVAVPAIFSAFLYGIDQIISAPLWRSTVGRVFAPSSFAIAEDASFLGREKTTVSGVLEIIRGPWKIFFLGSDAPMPLDSAIVSIALQSGILSAFLFFGLFFFLVWRSDLTAIHKLAVGSVFVVAALMMGDAIVPPVALIYFSAFYAFQRKSAVTSL